MIPADLLDQLREKDPGMWEKIAENTISEYEYHDEDFNEWISNVITYKDLFEPAQEAWLQHCLQERIRELRWRYYLSSATGQITCLIGISGNRQKIVVAETEAEALLRAYLAAKEASR